MQKINVLVLGAGNGSDILYLLQQGYTVYSVDFSSESIARIRSTITTNNEKLILIQSDFSELDWNTLPSFDVIIAINSISFIPRDNFYKIWNNIIHHHLAPRGVIVARLFGNKLLWPNMQNMTLITKEQFEQLIDGFDIIKNDEELYQDNDMIQHAYNLILRHK